MKDRDDKHERNKEQMNHDKQQKETHVSNEETKAAVYIC